MDDGSCWITWVCARAYVYIYECTCRCWQLVPIPMWWCNVSYRYVPLLLCIANASSHCNDEVLLSISCASLMRQLHGLWVWYLPVLVRRNSTPKLHSSFPSLSNGRTRWFGECVGAQPSAALAMWIRRCEYDWSGNSISKGKYVSTYMQQYAHHIQTGRRRTYTHTHTCVAHIYVWCVYVRIRGGEYMCREG